MTPDEFDMWKYSDVLRSDVHPPQLNLVLQSSTTPGQFDMWQNADVPWSGILPINWSSHLVVQSPTTAEYQNADIPRSDVPLVIEPNVP